MTTTFLERPADRRQVVVHRFAGITMTDIFCGGGGSSTGGTQVEGLEIVMAANHLDLAIRVHEANHPDSDHAIVDLHEEDPRFFPWTHILWASPECTKWSQASGGKYSHLTGGFGEHDLLSLLDPELIEEDPETAVVQRSRLLMFDVLRFAEHHRYPAMVIENVVDIATNSKFTDAWALWKKGLTNLGYDFRVVSLNSMHAQAHGDPAPQSRDRLYVVCWLKGTPAPDIDKVMRPLAWCPTCAEVVESQQAWKNGKTVGKYRAQYIYVHGACGTAVEPGYLPAAAAIDWTLKGKRIGDRTKPLAEKTLRRIAAGIAKYWSPFTAEVAGNQYDAADPKHAAHGDPNGYYRTWSTSDVLKTLHTQESKALVVPLEGRAGDRVNSAGDPLRAMTTRHQDAFVTKAEFGGQIYSAADVHPTLTTYDTASLIEPPPFMLDRRFDYRVRGIDEPMSTLTANDTSKALLQPPFIAELRGGGSTARPTADPLATITASGNHHGLVMPYYGASTGAQTTDKPIGTLTTVDRYALIHRHNTPRTGDGAEMLTPANEVMRTLTTAGHQSLLTPGDIKTAEAQVDDAYFRMLEPHEVAAGMAFPPDYIWSGTRRERVKLAGNAVTPPAARDLLHAVCEALEVAA